MKKLTLILTFLIINLIPARAIKKIEANPVNIASMLAQETYSAKIASMCNYYGYVNQLWQDSYIVFKHPNASIIRYTFKDSSKEQP